MNRSAVAVTLVCVAGFAQSPASMQIGTASLRLGMSEEQVAAALPSPFSMRRIQTEPAHRFSSWSITTPDRNGQFSLIATLAFRNGRLDSVRRNWGPSDQQAGIPLAKALYGAASQMVAEGRRHCILEVASRQDPRADQRTIFLHCSGKRLDISIFESDQIGSSVTIDEVLERTP